MKERGFTQINNKIIFDHQLSAGSKLTYAALKAHEFGYWNKSFPSHLRLARELGSSISSVKRHIKELKKAGYINVLKVPGSRSNHYSFPKLKFQWKNLKVGQNWNSEMVQKWPSNNTKVNKTKYKLFRSGKTQSIGEILNARRYQHL